MEVKATVGRDDIARVYIAHFEQGRYVEFVEAIQPPLPREEKWVLLISTLYGCPVECRICDAGGFYKGKVSKERMLAQIDYLVKPHYPDKKIPCKQFKIQFARMGEPAFNPDVLSILDEFDRYYDAPGFMPSISTIAPRSADGFLTSLMDIKKKKYSSGHFQFQFSVHTTDEQLRDVLVPTPKWSFAQMAAYGEQFFQPGDRKITLNFALAEQFPLDPDLLLQYFNPDLFLIKVTPLNPTYTVEKYGYTSYLDPDDSQKPYPLIEQLREKGYQVIISIGEQEENQIGSNCGQYVQKHLNAEEKMGGGYSYQVMEDPAG